MYKFRCGRRKLEDIHTQCKCIPTGITNKACIQNTTHMKSQYSATLPPARLITLNTVVKLQWNAKLKRFSILRPMRGSKSSDTVYWMDSIQCKEDCQPEEAVDRTHELREMRATCHKNPCVLEHMPILLVGRWRCLKCDGIFNLIWCRWRPALAGWVMLWSNGMSRFDLWHLDAWI